MLSFIKVIKAKVQYATTLRNQFTRSSTLNASLIADANLVWFKRGTVIIKFMLCTRLLRLGLSFFHKSGSSECVGVMRRAIADFWPWEGVQASSEL